jgi:hypothetical protein
MWRLWEAVEGAAGLGFVDMRQTVGLRRLVFSTRPVLWADGTGGKSMRLSIEAGANGLRSLRIGSAVSGMESWCVVCLCIVPGLKIRPSARVGWLTWMDGIAEADRMGRNGGVMTVTRESRLDRGESGMVSCRCCRCRVMSMCDEGPVDLSHIRHSNRLERFWVE